MRIFIRRRLKAQEKPGFPRQSVRLISSWLSKLGLCSLLAGCTATPHLTLELNIIYRMYRSQIGDHENVEPKKEPAELTSKNLPSK